MDLDKKKDEFNLYKRQAIRAARDLFYGKEVIQKLKEANNFVEIERIMAAARHES